MNTNKILVPVDGSDYSLQVLPQITHMLDPAHTTLVLLRVGPEPQLVELGAPGDPELTIFADQDAASMAGDFSDEMQPTIRELRSNGFDVVTAVRFGDPACEIERYIDEDGVTMVAMTTHGRTGLNRILFGSVAEHVLHHAQVPVMIYRSTTKTKN